MHYTSNLSKPLIAIALFVCLFDLPYGYYQFVRFISLIVFGILSYEASQKENKIEMIIYGGLALLFQPFLKISLGRELWNIIDLAVGVGLLISFYIDLKRSEKDTKQQE